MDFNISFMDGNSPIYFVSDVTKNEPAFLKEFKPTALIYLTSGRKVIYIE